MRLHLILHHLFCSHVMATEFTCLHKTPLPLLYLPLFHFFIGSLDFLTQFRSYCRCHLQCSISWGKLDRTSRSDSFSNMATKSSLLISHQSIRTLILDVLFFRCRPNSFSCHFEVFCVLLLRLRKAFTLDGLKTSSSALLFLDSLSCSTVYLCFCSFAFLSF